MTIGIDARCLEGARTGVGRYLINILEHWGCVSGHRFILYFKNSAPAIGILERPCYEKRVLRAPFGIKSNVCFQHLLLSKVGENDKIDILFSPSYILPFGWRKKSIVTVHDVSYEAYPKQNSFLDSLFLAKASRHSVKIASRILTITEFSKKEIIKYYKASPDKISVIPLGVDEKFQLIKNDKKIESVKKKYGIANDYIISIGSIFTRRHLPETMMGFLKVAEKFDNLQLLIIGKNHTEPFIDIEKLISDINDKLKRRAILHFEYVEDSDLLWLYNGAKLSIYLSDYEGFGLPPLEAAACGVPAIVSNIPTEKEVMDEAAIFIDNNKNIKEINEKMTSGLSDKKLREEMIKKGLERVKIFSWKKCAGQTLKAITNNFGRAE